MGRTESGVVKRWECPLCGGDEWLCNVENLLLLRICKQCGFEVKEMTDEAFKEEPKSPLVF